MKGKQPRTINPKARPGPKAASVAIQAPWESVVASAFKRKRPEGGWPVPQIKKRAAKK